MWDLSKTPLSGRLLQPDAPQATRGDASPQVERISGRNRGAECTYAAPMLAVQLRSPPSLQPQGQADQGRRDRSLLDPRLSGLQVKDEPGYPVPQVVAIGLPTAVEMIHPLVVRPEEVEPCVPGLRRRPFVLHVPLCPHVILVGGGYRRRRTCSARFPRVLPR